LQNWRGLAVRFGYAGLVQFSSGFASTNPETRAGLKSKKAELLMQFDPEKS